MAIRASWRLTRSACLAAACLFMAAADVATDDKGAAGIGGTQRQEVDQHQQTKPGEAKPPPQPDRPMSAAPAPAVEPAPHREQEATRDAKADQDREPGAQGRRGEQSDQQVNERIVQILTLTSNLVVTFFTGALFWVTRRQLEVNRIAAEAAVKAADASTKSANAAAKAADTAAQQARMLLAQERPLLVIDLIAVQVPPQVGELMVIPSQAAMQVTNYGRSPAIARVHGITGTLGQRLVGWEVRRLTGLNETIVQPGGTSLVIPIEIPTPRSAADVTAVQRREQRFAFEWRLLTEDVFGNWTLYWELYGFAVPPGKYALLARASGPLPTQPGNDPAEANMLASVGPMSGRGAHETRGAP